MKKFIKNNIKVFVAIIITTILVGSVSVYAASQIFAKDISFTPTNENFKKENGEPIDNIEDALNELYTKTSIPKSITLTLTTQTDAKTYYGGAFINLSPYKDLYKHFKITNLVRNNEPSGCSLLMYSTTKADNFTPELNKEYDVYNQNDGFKWDSINIYARSKSDGIFTECKAIIEFYN